MLELTVKTLDSTNTSFTLSDEATVRNLKDSILEKMDVPVNMQRLIYHGKVLQDEKKLTDYGDINGKVIHLVQRAPPSASRANDGSTRRSESAGGSERERGGGRRRAGRGPHNAIIIGPSPFMTFHGDEAPDRMMPPIVRDPDARIPNQMMARNRLESATRMLGYAKQSINNMKNPPAPDSAPGSDEGARPYAFLQCQCTNTHSQSCSGSASGSSGAGASAAPSTGEGASASSSSVSGSPSTSTRWCFNCNDQLSDQAAEFYDPDEVAVEVIVETNEVNLTPQTDESAATESPAVAAASSSDAGPSTAGPAADNPNEIVTRADAMAPLLTQLEEINADLQPMLARCRQILQTDTSFEDIASAPYQEAVRVFGGVTESLHSIAHACHALSDLMVDFDEDAPRSLRCRPVIVQRPLLDGAFVAPIPHVPVPGGFPPRLFPNEGGAASGSGSAGVPPTSAQQTPGTDAADETDQEDGPETPRSHSRGGLEIFMDFANFQTINPFDNDSQEPPITINVQNTPGGGQTINVGGTSSGPTFAAAMSAAASTAAAAAAAALGGRIVSTEGITVSSSAPIPPAGPPSASGRVPGATWETWGPIPNMNTFLSQFRNQFGTPAPTPTENVGAEGAVPPPPQAAVPPQQNTGTDRQQPPGAQYVLVVDAIDLPGQPPAGGYYRADNMPAVPEGTATAGTTPTGDSTTSTPSAPRSGQRPPTNPFTGATRRTGAGITMPPIHDMLHSLFGGSFSSFDPALPCNSRHIRNTRQRASPAQRLRVVPETAASGATAAPQPTWYPRIPRSARPFMEPTFLAVSVPTTVSTGAVPPAAATAVPPTAAGPGLEPSRPIQMFLELVGARDIGEDSTLFDVLNSLLDSEPTLGQSLISDFVITMARNVRWVDLMELVRVRSDSGWESQLTRLRPHIHTFVMQRLLDGQLPSQEALTEAVNRVNTEMTPCINAMESAAVIRDTIDMQATIQNYNMVELPQMLRLITESGSNTRFAPQLLHSLRQYMERLIALVKYCCLDTNGFLNALTHYVRQVTNSLPRQVQVMAEWPSMMSLNRFATQVQVPDEDIMGYVQFRDGARADAVQHEEMETDGWSTPPSEVEKESEAEEALLPINTENLPEVLIGSEPWHNSLPTDWVPVIARDGSRQRQQRRQGAQPPFSDAYLSGMPPKRRKLIQQSKPPADASVSTNIAEGVRQAIDAAGVSSPFAEAAAAAAAASPAVQAAYREQERTSARAAAAFHPGFNAARFPNAADFFHM